MWSRVRLRFAPGVEVFFADRETAIRQVSELARRGGMFPVVIYGPEGCGKTAFFRQVFEVLKAHGYSVVYVSPIAEDRGLVSTEDLSGVVAEILGEFTSGWVARVAEVVLRIALRAAARVRRLAVVADDVFQAVGAGRSEILVKQLLNLIEYPPDHVESAVVLIGSSEGVSRWRIGRHGWAEIYSMWNMPREGFRELYTQIPGEKPSFDAVWELTGGNPRILRELYARGWSPERVADAIVDYRRIVSFVRNLAPSLRRVLGEAVEDPDALAESVSSAAESGSLIDRMVEMNLVYEMPQRRDYLWIDTPPPERDPGLGIGKYYAWQTPLHREAVRRALDALSTEGSAE